MRECRSRAMNFRRRMRRSRTLNERKLIETFSTLRKRNSLAAHTGTSGIAAYSWLVKVIPARLQQRGTTSRLRNRRAPVRRTLRCLTARWLELLFWPMRRWINADATSLVLGASSPRPKTISSAPSLIYMSRRETYSVAPDTFSTRKTTFYTLCRLSPFEARTFAALADRRDSSGSTTSEATCCSGTTLATPPGRGQS